MSKIQEAIEARRRGGSAKQIARQLMEVSAPARRPLRRVTSTPQWKLDLHEELDLLEAEQKISDADVQKIKDLVAGISEPEVAAGKVAAAIGELTPEVRELVTMLTQKATPPEPAAPAAPEGGGGAPEGGGMEDFDLGDLNLGGGSSSGGKTSEAAEPKKPEEETGGEGATDTGDEGEKIPKKKENESLRAAMNDLIELGEAMRNRCAVLQYERDHALEQAGITESALYRKGHVYSMTERAFVRLTARQAMIENLIDRMISEEGGDTGGMVGPGAGPKIDLGVELEVPNAADPNGGDIINEPDDIDQSADDAGMPATGGGDAIDGGDVAQPVSGSGPAKMPESRMQMNMRTPMLGALLALEDARKKERTSRKHLPSRRDALRERREALKPRARQIAGQRAMGNREMLVDKLKASGIPESDAREIATKIMYHMAENNIEAAMLVVRHAPPHLQETVKREVQRLFKL